jgi:hypothetical protein
MRKALLTLATAATLLSVAACSDAPGTAPRTPDAPSELLGLPLTEPLDPLTAPLQETLDASGLPLVSSALRRKTALANDITATVLVGDEGGFLSIPAAGLRVEIPRGAVLGSPIRISARALAGTLVAYDFEPHGIRFAKPLRVTQELGGTQWLQTNPLLLKAVYFKDASQVDVITGLVRIDEVLPVSVDALRGRLSFGVAHFSGYAVSTGRQVQEEEAP